MFFLSTAGCPGIVSLTHHAKMYFLIFCFILLSQYASTSVFSTLLSLQYFAFLCHFNSASKDVPIVPSGICTPKLSAIVAPNYDHPDAFDNDLLIQHLKELKAGHAIDCPVYDYANHNRSSEVQHIEPAPVLIVEGILPLAEPELCSLFDYKIYVDTDADERILRRILRDVKERGRSLDSVIAQYRATVKPMHEAFVEPSKRNADIIIPNGGENGPAIEMLAHHIRSLIQKANLR